MSAFASGKLWFSPVLPLVASMCRTTDLSCRNTHEEAINEPQATTDYAHEDCEQGKGLDKARRNHTTQ